ncbi:MAG: hypothetical protein LBN42_03150, partial [Oscillospiraceae bacterium]|nr:hypothetical protein [Oscillospiraceae bacterium]
KGRGRSMNDKQITRTNPDTRKTNTYPTRDYYIPVVNAKEVRSANFVNVSKKKNTAATAIR